jgi:hypothetical protein
VPTNEFILDELRQLRAAISRPDTRSATEIGGEPLGISFKFHIAGEFGDADFRKMFKILSENGIGVRNIRHSFKDLEIVTNENQFLKMMELLNSSFPKARLQSVGGNVIR